jgi:hypothetical protein
MSITNEELEHREIVLSDLILHLSKIDEEQLKESTVQEIVEGFWMSREAQALSEVKPFQLEG